MNNPYYSSYNSKYENSVESKSKSDLMKVISLKLLKDDEGSFNPIILIVLCCCCFLCILIPFIIIIILIRGGHMEIPDFFPDNLIDFLCEHGILNETTHCSASPTPSPSPDPSVSGGCDATCLERRDKAERILRAKAYYTEQQRLQEITDGNSSETVNMCLNVLDSECCDSIESIDNSIYDTTLEEAISSGIFWKYVLSTVGAEDIDIVPDKYGMLIFIVDGREYCYWHTSDSDGIPVPFNPNAYGSLESSTQSGDQLPQEYISFRASENGHGVKYINLESQMQSWSERRLRIEQGNPKSEDKDWNGDYTENYSEWELVMDTDKLSPLFKKKYWFNWKVFKMVEKYIEDNCAGDIRDGFDSEKSLEIIKIASLDYLSIKQLNVNGLRPEDPTTWNTRNGNISYNSLIKTEFEDNWTRYGQTTPYLYNGWPTEGELGGDKNRQDQRDKMINDWRVVHGQYDLTVSNPYRLDKNGNIARTCGIINPWPTQWSSGSDEANSHTDSVKWNDYNSCSGSIDDNNCDGRRKIFKNLWSTWARENNIAVDADFSRNREADLDAINNCFDSSSQLKSCNVHLADSGVYNNPSFTGTKFTLTSTQKSWLQTNIDNITYPMSGPMDFVAAVKVYDMFLNTAEKNYIKEAISMSQRVKEIVEWYETFFNKPFRSDDSNEQTKLKFNSQKIPSCFDSKVETLKEQWDRYGEIRCFFSKVGCVGSEDSTSCTSVADDEIDSGTMKYCTWCSPDFNCLNR